MTEPRDAYREDAHAVIIGINLYLDPKIPNLRYARADAEAVYGVLTNPNVGRFKRENVILLLDEQATERGIRSAVGTQLPKHAAKEHTVFVYFAGHGAPVLDDEGKSSDGMEKYLVPHDAQADDLRASAIPMDAIQLYFRRIRASQVLFFIDSCYSGVAGGRTFEHQGYNPRAHGLNNDFLQKLGGEGRLVITACGANEISLETSEEGHGLFTQYLVHGLEGEADSDQNGLITIDELYDYVYLNVNRAAQRLGGSMKPIKTGSVTGTVYLTQCETPVRREARLGSAEAAAAFDHGDLDTAERLWKQVVVIDSHHEAARRGLDVINERRAEAQRKLEEEERRKKKKQRVLLRHRGSGQLPIRHFTQAWTLLESDPRELPSKEKEIKELVEHLTDGQITPVQYVRSVELIEEDADPEEEAAKLGSMVRSTDAIPAALEELTRVYPDAQDELRDRSRAAVPVLQAIPHRIDFGTRLQGSTPIIPLALKNVGGGSLEFSFEKRGDFFTVSEAPGGLSLRLEAIGPGRFAGALKIASNGGEATIHVSAHVWARRTIQLTIAAMVILALSGVTYQLWHASRGKKVEGPTVTPGHVGPPVFAFEPDTATLVPGHSITLHLSGAPARPTRPPELHWSSSDSKVATVDSHGEVKAVATGSATITAARGSIGDSARATITVLQPSAPLRGTAVTVLAVDQSTGNVKVRYHLDLDKGVLGFYTEQFPGARGCAKDDHDRFDLAHANRVIKQGDGDLQFQLAKGPGGGARSFGINLWTEKNGHAGSLIKQFPQYDQHCQ